MPGGGQDVEELLPKTVCREVAEEIGVQVDVKDLVFVIEGYHIVIMRKISCWHICLNNILILM